MAIFYKKNTSKNESEIKLEKIWDSLFHPIHKAAYLDMKKQYLKGNAVDLDCVYKHLRDHLTKRGYGERIRDIENIPTKSTLQSWIWNPDYSKSNAFIFRGHVGDVKKDTMTVKDGKSVSYTLNPYHNFPVDSYDTYIGIFMPTPVGLDLRLAAKWFQLIYGKSNKRATSMAQSIVASMYDI